MVAARASSHSESGSLTGAAKCCVGHSKEQRQGAAYKQLAQELNSIDDFRQPSEQGDPHLY